MGKSIGNYEVRKAKIASMESVVIGFRMIPMDKYTWCNHYHELDENYEMVDFGDGPFVANKVAVPLLRALNQAGLKTRTHHHDW